MQELRKGDVLVTLLTIIGKSDILIVMGVQAISIVRGRGQLTISEFIRRQVKWADPLSAVILSVERSTEIVIKPHSGVRDVDWDTIWQGIRLARSFKGRNESQSALQMISKDRENR